jgi:hypothetical protein
MRKKDLIQLGVTGILVIILIFALGNASKKSRLRNLKNVSPKATDSAEVLSNQSKNNESRGLYDMLEQQAKSIELKRDLFTAAPIVSEKALQSGIDLTGILWDKDKPLAIINGEIVKKGVRVNGKTIIDIKRDKVILSDGAVLSELKLEQ